MQYGRAEIFERQYGAMLRQPPLSDLTSARYLQRALQAKGIDVTEGVVKQWLLKSRTGDAAVTGAGVSSIICGLQGFLLRLAYVSGVLPMYDRVFFSTQYFFSTLEC